MNNIHKSISTNSRKTCNPANAFDEIYGSSSFVVFEIRSAQVSVIRGMNSTNIILGGTLEKLEKNPLIDSTLIAPNQMATAKATLFRIFLCLSFANDERTSATLS